MPERKPKSIQLLCKTKIAEITPGADNRPGQNYIGID